MSFPLAEATLSPQMRAALGSDALRLAEEWLATRCSPEAPPPPPQAPPVGVRPRVVVVCHRNTFMFDRERMEKRVWNWSTQATGEVVCATALIRYLSTFAELRVSALWNQQKSAVESWEGIHVECGEFHDRGEPIIIATTSDPLLVKVVGESSAIHKFVFAHHAALDDCRKQLFGAGITLLCCSEYLQSDIVKRWRQQRTQVCYAADYGVFDNYGVWEGGGDFVTCVSPCQAKGIDVLCALARRMPAVRFLAAATRWTTSRDKEKLAGLQNVRLSPGFPHQRIDVDFFSKTRLLLVPSIWPEPYGLIATEASIRGVPVVSTDAAGLVESNLGGITVHSDIYYSLEDGQTYYECDGTRRLATHADFDILASRFAKVIQPLLDDGAKLSCLSQRQRLAATKHVVQRRHKLCNLLRSLLE